MNFLLDTHTFLWYIKGDARLSQTAHEAIEDLRHAIFLSTGTLLEIAILEGLGRINLGMGFNQLVNDHVEANQMQVLTIMPAHLEVYKLLPFHHRDPFDRLLLSQAQAEQMTLISLDPEFHPYGLPVLW